MSIADAAGGSVMQAPAKKCDIHVKSRKVDAIALSVDAFILRTLSRLFGRLDGPAFAGGSVHA